MEQWAADCVRRPGSSWGFGALLKGLTSVVDTSCQSRDSNPQPWVTSGFKSYAPLGHDCPQAVTKYCCKLPFGKPTVSKLIPEVCEAICLCSFLQLPCESIPHGSFFTLRKLITAREINAHVRPARTKCARLRPKYTSLCSVYEGQPTSSRTPGFV